MKPFIFQKFEVKQHPDVFRVGTDGVILGAMCTAVHAEKVLEVGTGTGFISMMIAQRNPLAQIIAIDVNELAIKLAEYNFQQSIFSKRIEAVHENFLNFNNDSSYDLIVSNPPYFPENTSTKDRIARQTIELSFSGLLETSRKLLTPVGIISIIVPASSEELIQHLAFENHLFVFRKVYIKGNEHSKIKRIIMELSSSPKNLVEENLIVEKSPRIFSDQYLEITKEFHVLKK